MVVAKKGLPISVPDVSSFHYIILLGRELCQCSEAGSDRQIYASPFSR